MKVCVVCVPMCIYMCMMHGCRTCMHVCMYCMYECKTCLILTYSTIVVEISILYYLYAHMLAVCVTMLLHSCVTLTQLYFQLRMYHFHNVCTSSTYVFNSVLSTDIKITTNVSVFNMH